jgi:penicillin-binding protein 1A
MRPETAYVLVNVMKGVIERGTATRAKVLERPLAGKTGTTDDAMDVWFVGFSPQLVAGVWVGYDIKRSLGNAETGGRLALPLWVSFMQKALADFPAEDFPMPENLVSYSVVPQTGRPASPGEKGSIREFYIRGNEPKERQASAPDRPLPSGSPSSPPSPPSPPPAPVVPPAGIRGTDG